MGNIIRLAILGSGNGTNAQQISEYFAGRDDVEVACIIYNKKDAFIAQRARNLGIEGHYFGWKDFYQSSAVLDYLRQREVDWVILAGFLWLVPEAILEAYPNRVINIHPALLPKYGGKGMYGHHVHEAVVEHGEKESGITIHIVDNRYDCGTMLFQAKCEVASDDTPDTLAAKIHLLEKEYFPRVIDETIHRQQ
ncbi:MAG: phosphoribosylglycinamide formyltransferase [Bacteroidales bacterium]|nr:phosphoribosylglycinamide formyltransferase [Bacteroidales bacterium]